jgi:hypothetical protein
LGMSENDSKVEIFHEKIMILKKMNNIWT